MKPTDLLKKHYDFTLKERFSEIGKKISIMALGVGCLYGSKWVFNDCTKYNNKKEIVAVEKIKEIAKIDLENIERYESVKNNKFVKSLNNIELQTSQIEDLLSTPNLPIDFRGTVREYLRSIESPNFGRKAKYSRELNKYLRYINYEKSSAFGTLFISWGVIALGCIFIKSKERIERNRRFEEIDYLNLLDSMEHKDKINNYIEEIISEKKCVNKGAELSEVIRSIRNDLCNLQQPESEIFEKYKKIA